MSKFLVQGRDARPAAQPHLGQRRRRRCRAPSPTRSGSTSAARSRPTSPSPSSTTTASGSSPPTPPTATSDHLAAAPTTPTTRTPFVTDVTSGYAQLNVQGPRSRELLQPLTSVDLSNEAFPFRTAREIDIGFARVLCIRITYVGELGYELYIPAEQALHVYDRLIAAGAAVGLRHAGLKALGSLRMEKGYRDYGHDIDNTDPVLDAGLGSSWSTRQAGRLHRPRRGGRGEGRRSAHPSPGPGAGQRPRAAPVPRRGRPPRRQAGRLRARPPPTATRSAAPSAWPWSRPASTGRPGLPRRRRTGRSRSPVAASRPSPRIKPLYDPEMRRVRS